MLAVAVDRVGSGDECGCEAVCGVVALASCERVEAEEGIAVAGTISAKAFGEEEWSSCA